MRFLSKLGRVDRFLGVVCLFVIVLSVLIHVAFRLANHPLVGAQEFESYIFVFLVYISVGYVTREGGHIRFDTLLLSFPPSVRVVVNRIIYALCAILFGITTYSAIVTMVTNTANKTPTLGIPFIAFILPTTIGFLLMTLEYAYYTFKGQKGDDADPVSTDG